MANSYVNNKACTCATKWPVCVMFASTEGKDISVSIHRDQSLVTLQMDVVFSLE